MHRLIILISSIMLLSFLSSHTVAQTLPMPTPGNDEEFDDGDGCGESFTYSSGYHVGMSIANGYGNECCRLSCAPPILDATIDDYAHCELYANGVRDGWIENADCPDWKEDGGSGSDPTQPGIPSPIPDPDKPPFEL